MPGDDAVQYRTEPLRSDVLAALAGCILRSRPTGDMRTRFDITSAELRVCAETAAMHAFTGLAARATIQVRLDAFRRCLREGPQRVSELRAEQEARCAREILRGAVRAKNGLIAGQVLIHLLWPDGKIGTSVGPDGPSFVHGATPLTRFSPPDAGEEGDTISSDLFLGETEALNDNSGVWGSSSSPPERILKLYRFAGIID